MIVNLQRRQRILRETTVHDNISRKLGILAYGSLIDEPGDELKNATTETLTEGVITPFKVEFARSSKTRAGAPTLTPVDTGGAQVPARVFVLDPRFSEKEASDILWRRETGNTDTSRGYIAPMIPGENDVVIGRLDEFDGVKVVLHTKIAPNIEPLTGERLAELALKSAGALSDGRDGISYLIHAQSNGAKTPLSDAYEDEI